MFRCTKVSLCVHLQQHHLRQGQAKEHKTVCRLTDLPCLKVYALAGLYKLELGTADTLMLRSCFYKCFLRIVSHFSLTTPKN